MANLQKTLDALQPYVIGIRYVDRIAVVDTVFKDGWTLPESDVIARVKGDETLNYHMIYSEKEGIGIDELLDYVSVTIQANIEREKKHELLKEKINELKIVFKKNNLTKLKRLKFNFEDENLTPELDEFGLDELDEPTEVEAKVEEKIDPPIVAVEEPPMVLPQNTQGLTEEDLEILEEEKRAENYRKIQDLNKKNKTVKNLQKVELPPRNRKQELVLSGAECDCGPTEACNKCIESKDL